MNISEWFKDNEAAIKEILIRACGETELSNFSFRHYGQDVFVYFKVGNRSDNDLDAISVYDTEDYIYCSGYLKQYGLDKAIRNEFGIYFRNLKINEILK